jgi:hypothetical protein
MSMITYANKAAVNVNAGIPDINKCNATDLNEIKDAFNNYVMGGWYTGKTGTTYSYVSWNATTKVGVVSTNQDTTTLLSVGMKVRFVQSAVTKYGIITAITASQITLFMGTDYTLNNSVITDAYYSMLKAPYGFPMSSDKWSLTFDFSGNALITPTNGTWYTLFSQLVPLGLWDVYATLTNRIHATITANSYVNMISILSNVNNGYGTLGFLGNNYTMDNPSAGILSHADTYREVKRGMLLTADTTVYMLGKYYTNGSFTANQSGKYGAAQLKLVCAYI